MTHFALICPPFLSHVRAFEAIAAVLVERGHRATMVHQADVRGLVTSPAVAFEAVGTDSHPAGSLATTLRCAADPVGPLRLLRLVRDTSRATAMLCREAPAALRRIGAEALIADQMEPAGGLVADALGVPFVSVACGLPINSEPDVPLPFLPWRYDPTPSGRRRNGGGERVSAWLMREHARTIAACAARFGLPPRRGHVDCLSPLAQISQTVAGFDFPRRELPKHFHHVGPLRPRQEDAESLGLPIASDRPFVFASLGTLQGGRYRTFRTIAEACRGLGLQLLVAHCGGLNEQQAASLGATWVTDFAPQRSVLARADLAITHAGLNTVLDALSFGVPLAAIPIAFDQPGVAARIVHAGVGERLPHRFLTSRKLRETLKKILADDRYRRRAELLAREIAGSGGAVRAADIIEAAVHGGEPVLAQR